MILSLTQCASAQRSTVPSFVDAFIFFNELELLEVRLHELAPVVDRFLLVESTHTFQGKPKPLYFDENKSLFKQYNISHIISQPKIKGDLSKAEAFENEAYQRDALQYTLRHLDTVMISDVDEIPSREVMKQIRQLPVKIQQRNSYYYLNMVSSEPWYGTVVALASDAIRVSPEALRSMRVDPAMPRIAGGWHFSYLGGPERIKQKLESFAHVEHNTDEKKDLAYLEGVMKQGVDLFGRDKEYHRIDVDDTFPHLVRERPEKFSGLTI